MLTIIGSIPPPIGGVSIHTKRLLDHLDDREYPYTFLNLQNVSLKLFIIVIIRSRWIHLHTSNVYLRFFLAIWCKLSGKGFINTIHGNLGRFNAIKNFLDNLSVSLSTVPIVLNKQSFNKAIKLNKASLCMSAFIPPLSTQILEQDLLEEVNRFSEKFSTVFATNAYNFSIDRYGNEIYQISFLVQLFTEEEALGLIISDPSGAYKEQFMNRQIGLPSNILLISKPHSFFEVLKYSDVFLRITTTDGDSISIREALFLGKNVIATNVVDRPDGTMLVNNKKEDIAEMISNYNKKSTEPISVQRNENVADQLLKLYLANIPY